MRVKTRYETVQIHTVHAIRLDKYIHVVLADEVRMHVEDMQSDCTYTYSAYSQTEQIHTVHAVRLDRYIQCIQSDWTDA